MEQECQDDGWYQHPVHGGGEQKVGLRLACKQLPLASHSYFDILGFIASGFGSDPSNSTAALALGGKAKAKARGFASQISRQICKAATRPQHTSVHSGSTRLCGHATCHRKHDLEV